jgi:lipopolysaccharide transport system ATP-binding protein
VGSLLEVGTGFHPELTGRENVFLNGAVLGMRRSEIRSQFDEIVQFAGVERFLDMPVKRYSSGMYVRLAFAVAAHLKSEILLIDEVLAVGDVDFQRRCLGKMRDVARSGRTILFVSHHLQSVTSLCNRLLVLDGGRLIHDGEVHSGIQRYLEGFAKKGDLCDGLSSRHGSGEMRLVSAAPVRDFFEPAEPKKIHLTLERKRPFTGNFFVSSHLVDAEGTVIAQCDSRLLGCWFEAADRLDIAFEINNLWLKPGRYRVDVFLCAAGFLDQCEHACVFEVLPVLPYEGAAGSEATACGLILANFIFRQTSSIKESDQYE